MIYELDPETGVLTKHYSLLVAYILWALLGLVGAHWFYLGRPRMGAVYFITAGIFGFGWVVDGFNLPDIVRQKNHPS